MQRRKVYRYFGTNCDQLSTQRTRLCDKHHIKPQLEASWDLKRACPPHLAVTNSQWRHQRIKYINLYFTQRSNRYCIWNHYTNKYVVHILKHFQKHIHSNNTVFQLKPLTVIFSQNLRKCQRMEGEESDAMICDDDVLSKYCKLVTLWFVTTMSSQGIVN